jgi:hypothetical protein
MCAPEPPEPDPNIGAAAASSAQVAADTLAWNKQVYAEGATMRQQTYDLAKKFADSAVTSQQFNDDLSRQYFDRLKSTFFPVENSMVNEAMNAGGAEDQEQYANLARGDVATGLSNQNAQNARTMQSMGVNPNSGRYQAMLRTQGVSNAAIGANAMNQARNAARQLGWAKRADAAALGRNLPSNQATSSQIALGASQAGMNASMQPVQAGVMQQNAMNQGFGTALQGYNQQGQLGLGSYQGQLQGYNMQNEFIGGMVGTAGSLLSAGIGAFGPKPSDRRLKKNIVLVGKTAHDLNLYEFEYLWGYVRHEGVMADEVLDVFPAAVVMGANGFMAVDYQMLGIEFK